MLLRLLNVQLKTEQMRFYFVHGTSFKAAKYLRINENTKFSDAKQNHNNYFAITETTKHLLKTI